MKTITINSAKELKSLVNNSRKSITNINGIECNELYPIIEVSNKHAAYYSVEEQGNKSLNAPFIVILK